MSSPYETKVSIADESKFKAALRSAGEQSHLFNLCHLKPVPKGGNTIPLTRADRAIYELAIHHALGRETAFPRLAGEAAVNRNQRFFEVARIAIKDMRLASDNKFSVTTAHAIAALQAKLEIEQSIRMLPTQMQVKKRAFVLVKFLFKDQNFEPYEPNAKAWTKVLRLATLDYLLTAVRGKGGRN